VYSRPGGSEVLRVTPRSTRQHWLKALYSSNYIALHGKGRPASWKLSILCNSKEKDWFESGDRCVALCAERERKVGRGTGGERERGTGRERGRGAQSSTNKAMRGSFVQGDKRNCILNGGPNDLYIVGAECG
jgi:hypothetical protein